MSEEQATGGEINYHLRTETPRPSAGEPLTREEKSRQRFYWGLISGGLLVVLLFVGVFIYNALRNLANDKVTLTVAYLTGLPAGFVDGHRLTYFSYQEDLGAVRHFYDYQGRQNPSRVLPSDEEIKKNVWDRLVKNLLTQDLLRQADLAVKPEEVNQEFEKVVQDYGSDAAVQAMLAETYGWTPQQFKDKILYPYLSQEKLGTASSTLELLKSEQKNNLDEYLNDLMNKVKTWKWVKI